MRRRMASFSIGSAPRTRTVAGGWELLGVEDAEQGGLAGAVPAQQSRDGRAFDVDGHVVER